MTWPDELCPNCRKPLHRKKVYCPSCLTHLPARMKQDAEEATRTSQERALRQEHSFLQEFDRRAFDLVVARLKKLEKVTVSELIDVLLAEGFFDKYKSGYQVDGVVYQLPTDRSQLKFCTWARKRVLGLAKWWAKHEVAFIGAQVSQGHPYLFYLGNKPDALFDPTMPKKSIAQRSVNKAVRTLTEGLVLSSDGEVSG